MEGALAVRIDVYTHQDDYVGTIGADALLALSHTDELNGEDSLAITTTFPLKQGYRLVWADHLGKVHEHVCQDPQGLHAGGATVYTDTALNSICEFYGDYIEDRRPYSYSFLKALQVALENTRWECGTVDQSGTVSSGLTFYHTSAREALQAILECGGELETEIEVSGNKVSARRLGIRQHRGESSTHRRFTYTKDLTSISRTEHFSAITACYGYGKGVETDSGGYGRKLTFGDINDGKNYVEDAAALRSYGRPDGKGGFANVFGKYENSECEDAEQLLSETKAYLAEHNEPGVSYEADAIDLVQFGRSWEGVGVGDDVQIVDTEYSPELRCSGRVTKLVTDLLGGAMTVTLGNVTETMADIWGKQQQAFTSLANRSSNWDVAANTPAAYLQQVIDGLNAQFNAQGMSYCFTSFEQGTIWSSVPLDENGHPTKAGGSAIQICSQGFRIASGTKADGSWDWRTFGTGNGFTADMITTGTLIANLITAGILQDKTGDNYWNLDTGELRLTGYAKDSETISSVDVEYAQSQSATTAPTSGWQTAAPAYKSGYYIWSRTKTVNADGTASYSTPVMISGRDGADGGKGDTGIGVSAIVEQYYLSTSKTSQVGGSWSETQPAYVSGRYYWTRSEVTWTDSAVTYTTPVLAQGVNNANEEAEKANGAVAALSTQEAIFNLLTNNGAIDGLYMKDGKLYVNASYIGSGVYQIQDSSGKVIVKLGSDVENGIQVYDKFTDSFASLAWTAIRSNLVIPIEENFIHSYTAYPTAAGSYSGSTELDLLEFVNQSDTPIFAGSTGRVRIGVNILASDQLSVVLRATTFTGTKTATYNCSMRYILSASWVKSDGTTYSDRNSIVMESKSAKLSITSNQIHDEGFGHNEDYRQAFLVLDGLEPGTVVDLTNLKIFANVSDAYIQDPSPYGTTYAGATQMLCSISARVELIEFTPF